MFASEIEDFAAEMREFAAACPDLSPCQLDGEQAADAGQGGWLPRSPFPVATAWQQTLEMRGEESRPFWGCFTKTGGPTRTSAVKACLSSHDKYC